MELAAEQYAQFEEMCREIKPGEYGRVIVSFIGEPSNVVDIIAEKHIRFQHRKAALNSGRANIPSPEIRRR
jgi:hypothetical protein